MGKRGFNEQEFVESFAEREQGPLGVLSPKVTAESQIRGTDQPRDLVFRFERSQILRAYRMLRKEIQAATTRGRRTDEAKALLEELRPHEQDQEWQPGVMGQLKQDLDELNRQNNEQVRRVTVEGPEIGRHTMPVVELDISKPAVGQPDERIPYVVIGGIGQNAYKAVTYSAGLALAGNRVFTLSYPENPTVQAPDDWAERLERDKTFRLHAEVMKRVTNQLGFERVNLYGDSMGGGIALEMGSDPDFADKIQDLIVTEPMGLENHSQSGIAYKAICREVLGHVLSNAEARIKSWSQGNEKGGPTSQALKADVEILRQRQFGHDKLASIHPRGRYQVWYATKSTLLNDQQTSQALLGAEADRLASGDKGVHPLELYRVESNMHGWPMVHAVGLARRLQKPVPKEQVTTLQVTELEHSAAEAVLRDFQAARQNKEQRATGE